MNSGRRAQPASPAKLDKYRRRYAEIIDAAAAVFADKGYHGASTKDIADRLGLRQGSLYYYLSSKESALEEVCQKGIEGFVQGLEAIVASGGSARDRLRAAILNHMAPIRDRPDYVRVFLADRHELPPESRRKIAGAARHYEQLLEDLLASGTRSGEFRDDLDWRLATLGLLAMGNGVAAWYADNGDRSLEDIAEAHTSVFLNGIVAHAK